MLPVLSSDTEADLKIFNKNLIGKLIGPFLFLKERNLYLQENQNKRRVSIGLWLEFFRKKGLAKSLFKGIKDSFKASTDIELPENSV